MKKLFLLILFFVATLVACSDDSVSSADENNTEISSTANQPESSSSAKSSNSVKDSTVASSSSTVANSSSTIVSKDSTKTQGKILVAYFSRTGNTKPLAEYAAEILGADLYEITAAVPYTDEDIAYYTDCRADREQKDESARPEISGSVEDMSQYSTVLIAHPIWHGQAPRIISTFLESYDFSGKTLTSFCTSASSPLGSSAENLKKLVPNSTWLDSRRFEIGSSKNDVEKWLNSIGL
jgi:flavodoxin